MSFSLHKYFKNQYLLEGDWDKLSSGEASDEADDIIELIKSAYAYIGGRKAAGEKFVATGHDGSREAKRAVITHKIDRLKKPGFYVEVSGKIKDILLKAGVPQVTDQATIEKALAGKDIIMNDDGSYTRSIAGTKHEKIMLGTPLV